MIGVTIMIQAIDHGRLQGMKLLATQDKTGVRRCGHQIEVGCDVHLVLHVTALVPMEALVVFMLIVGVTPDPVISPMMVFGTPHARFLTDDATTGKDER